MDMDCNTKKKPAGVLMLQLLVILKVLGTAEADCSSTCLSSCDCSSLGLTSVPQDLPRTISSLDLRSNQITTLSQSDFSRYPRLRTLRLDDNLISTINSHAFSPLTNLINLGLSRNRLTSLGSDMFTGLGNLNELSLNSNQINDIQVGTFDSTPRLGWFKAFLDLSDNNITTFPLARLQRLSSLYLENNQMKILPSTAYDKLLSLSDVRIGNNPWQCDCRMVDFRLKMTGSRPFENQITCSQPDNLYGQSLLGINPGDLICTEPTIARFQKIAKKRFVQGGSIHFVCEASGIPKPDITVILPSGLNATVESGGEVNVTTVTAHAGLCVCIATNLAGSTFATLVVNLQTVTTATSPLPTTSNSPDSTTDHDSAQAAFSPTVVASPSKLQSSPCFSLPVLLAAICGSIAGTLFIGGIILAIWCKRNNQSPPKRPDFSVVYNNTNTTTQTQPVSLSLDVRNPHLIPRPVSVQSEPYEDVQPPPRGAVLMQTARGQALQPPNGNNNEPPPLPPPRTASANIPEHAYQSLAVTRNQPEYGHDASHHYQSLRRT
ncbi:PREDICTED: leucine-rich repeat-containing protein 24-like [Branchiostoma belcheri]|uniref:Leucine-rich repeat-containing protein 24-like n=1 Tax=Branchiostoma belcheri TaxID=7741 RepID=A0A6P4XSQ9_BRABE|nr:PREDICTED: leucine-rich repeat-containing protein 24-like [Branchiostoma belcheri]